MYSKNMVNYSMVLDSVPTLAKLYFNETLMNYTQAGVLLGVGLQYKSFENIKEEFDAEMNWILVMFNKTIKKFCCYIQIIYANEIGVNEQNEFNES